jgi:hypothetical protein
MRNVEDLSFALVREKLIKLINTEEQLLFLLHLVGPFLQRLHTDR